MGEKGHMQNATVVKIPEKNCCSFGVYNQFAILARCLRQICKIVPSKICGRQPLKSLTSCMVC